MILMFALDMGFVVPQTLVIAIMGSQMKNVKLRSVIFQMIHFLVQDMDSVHYQTLAHVMKDFMARNVNGQHVLENYQMKQTFVLEMEFAFH